MCCRLGTHFWPAQIRPGDRREITAIMSGPRSCFFAENHLGIGTAARTPWVDDFLYAEGPRCQERDLALGHVTAFADSLTVASANIFGARRQAGALFSVTEDGGRYFRVASGRNEASVSYAQSED